MILPAQHRPSSTTRLAAGVDLLQGRDALLHALRQLPPPSAAGPVTTSAAWVRRALQAAPAAATWGLLVRTGDVHALAALVDRVDATGTRTDLLTGGGGYLGGLLAGTGPLAAPEAAESLAGALGAALAHGADARRTAVHLTGLPGTPAVEAFAAAAGGRAVPELPVPVVERPAEGAHLVSAGMRKNLRKTANRLATDGVHVDLVVSRDPAAFEAALPEIEVAYRDRDAAHGLACPLDTPAGRRTWLDRLAALGEVGRRELATLRLDGELAAYVVGVPGAGRYGVFEGRFVTRWARYSPGRVLEHAVLQHAFTDPAVHVVDWMTGVAPETLLTVSRFEPRVAVHREAGGAGGRVLVGAQPASAR